MRSTPLGLTTADGFAPGDLTSPARAATVGALVDRTVPDAVTELRIHGVSGSAAPPMLEHPASVQVAGDHLAGFHRRWTPAGQGAASVPWRVEAYSWGGLTVARLASASWILLTPFMLYNVAHFMLPGRDRTRQRCARNRVHDAADAVLRLLALTATLQMVLATFGVLVDTVALQAGGEGGRLPGMLRWFALIPAAGRVTLALGGVLAVVGLLWIIGVRTANSYEARTTAIDPEASQAPQRWPLAEAAFWRGRNLVERQRTVHTTAALGAVALIGALPGWPATPQRVCAVAGGLVLLAAVVMTLSRATNRFYVAHGQAETRRGAAAATEERAKNRTKDFRLGAPVATKPRRVVTLVVANGAVVATAAVGWSSGMWATTPSMTDHLAGVWVWLTAVQIVLVVLLAGLVGVLALGRRSTARPGPYLGGMLGPVVVALAVVLGGLLSAVVAISGAQPFGSATNGITVPQPLYAFAAAPLGFLGAGVLAAPFLYFAYRRDRVRHESNVAKAYGALGPVRDLRSRLGMWRKRKEPGAPMAYGAQTPWESLKRRLAAWLDPQIRYTYTQDRRRVARAWAVGGLADRLGVVLAALTAGGVLSVIVAVFSAPIVRTFGFDEERAQRFGEAMVSTSVLVALAIAAALVALLRSAYADGSRRRTIGAVWDVGTFWPRAAHPLAPPCYAERAVPEVVDRVTALTGRAGDVADEVLPGPVTTPDAAGLTITPAPVLLTGYSQGSILAPAVVAQLHTDVLGDVALLTLACPARRLYGRAFPAFFGPEHLAALAALLPGDGRPRWTNAVRRSDYIGSWVARDPDKDEKELRPGGPPPEVDVWCWDPVALVGEGHPAPPIHAHSAWWPDPQVAAQAEKLVKLLDARRPPTGAPSDARPALLPVRCPSVAAPAVRDAIPDNSAGNGHVHDAAR